MSGSPYRSASDSRSRVWLSATLFLLLFGSIQYVEADERQTTSGDCSPIVANADSVSIECGISIQDVEGAFYNVIYEGKLIDQIEKGSSEILEFTECLAEVLDLISAYEENSRFLMRRMIEYRDAVLVENEPVLKIALLEQFRSGVDSGYLFHLHVQTVEFRSGVFKKLLPGSIQATLLDLHQLSEIEDVFNDEPYFRDVYFTRLGSVAVRRYNDVSTASWRLFREVSDPDEAARSIYFELDRWVTNSVIALKDVRVQECKRLTL